MSDRDDIDVIDNAKNNAESESALEKTGEESSSNSKFNQAIRQNPLTHSDEKSAGKSIFGKLKRAFSPADGDEKASEEDKPENGDVLGSLVNKFKRNKTDSDNVGNQSEIKTNINTTVKNEEAFDPEEEEEFKMISAFLEGEEYIPPQLKASKSEEKADTPKEESKSEEKADTSNVKTEEKDKASNTNNKNIEYDSQNALENEEANFEVNDAFDNEEAEFVMIDIDDDADFVDDIDDILDNENTDNKSNEINQENSDNKSVDNKPEESKSEEKTEIKSEETKSEEKTKIEYEETKSEEKTELESEETKSEDKTDAEPGKTNPEDKTEVESKETISDEKTNEKPENKSDDIKVESINGEGDNTSADDELDDDEEFQFEEDYVFDESDDDDFDELAEIEDFEELEGLFNTSQSLKDKSSKENEKEEENSQTQDKKEAVPENKSEPKSEAESESKSENQTPEPEEDKKESETPKEEKNEVESVVADKNETKPESTSENPNEDTKKSEEKQETESSVGEEPVIIKHEGFEDISSNSGKEDKKQGSALGKFKSAVSAAKSKLFKLWNTKSDGSVVGSEENTHEPEEKKNIPEDNQVIDITEVTSGSGNNEPEKPVEDIKISEPTTADIENSETDEKPNNDMPPKIIPMTVIKNENASVVPIDREKVRESLSVIERDQKPPEPDILTDEQKHQLEMNQKVLEKVKQYEEETAEKREELRKARAERSAKAYEKAFGTVDPITEIEITNYIDVEPEEIIKVKAGKFTESVRSEYEFYVGYTRLKNVAKKQTRVEPPKPEVKAPAPAKAAPTERTKLDESSYAEFSEDKFAKSRDKLDSISKRLDYKDSKHPEGLEYRTEDDAVEIKKLLQENLKKAKMKWNLSLGLTFAMFVLCCIGGAFTVGAGEEAKDSSMRAFAFINLAIYGAMLYNCRGIIIRGLQPLKKIRSNSDTGFAVAAVVTAFQSVLALITPTPFFRQGLNVYTLIVMLALAMNSLGKQRNADRISSNFRFVSDSSQKYTGKFFHDQRMVATLLSGTRNDKSELVFQKKTAFLKHFMKLSHSPDPGENLADKFSLPTIVFSLIISIVYLFLSKSFTDTISVLSIMLCAAVPMCSKALGAVPLHKLAKNSLANQSMVVGYQAVDSFSESAAVMLDAKELYPEGSVHLNGIKTFDSRRIDDAMLAAASVIITAGGAMAGMFDGIIQGDKQENLPTAENVIYEDGKGLIGWVNNERIFVGNRQLLRSHGIEPMTEEYEAEQKVDGDEILYLACAGELVAMFIVGYSANRRVADALRRMEANGMSMLIRTTDVNITAERIAKDFGVSHRSIKILEQKNSNVVRDEMIGKEKSSPAFVATKGGVTSFGRAVSGCIQTKRNISLSLAVQVFGVLLGLLIVTVIALVSGVHHIGAVPMFFFYLFWVAAVLGAPPIMQKIQKY